MSDTREHAYWFHERLTKAFNARKRAKHKLRMGDRLGHRWLMNDAIFYLKLAKERKAAMQ